MTLKSWKPAAGRRVRKLDGSVLVDAGEPLPRHPYYARLIADGDLVPVKKTRSIPA